MAELSGKESALFCLTGTMSNFLAVISQCHPGDEVLGGDISHLGLGSKFKVWVQKLLFAYNVGGLGAEL